MPAAEGYAVVESSVIKEVPVERTVREQGIGKRVLRKRHRIHGVEIIVIRQGVIRERIEVEIAVGKGSTMQRGAVPRLRTP
ncbi:hypothetical protein [Arthrobacter sp. OAP107]|uniref:hypothetical protein n=1 Tax=Arthrobacter sp. OAP107 TaxID=3156445 RepID=UPI00339485F2